MHSTWLLALSICTSAAFASIAAQGTSQANVLRTRNLVDEIADDYDFVIVGGGLAGLVLGSRLSEDSNHTVLVLESGGNGDQYRSRIDTPGYAYFQSLWPTEVNWAFKTIPQPGAKDRMLDWPRGKVLGGSSAINGLYLTRPSQIEIDAWRSMLGDMPGADNWSWESLYAAIKKSETFTPADDAVVQEAAITWNAASHGTNGPVHMSWPGYTFPQVGQWSTSMQSAGVAISHDTYGGQSWGACVSMSAINPANWTRSYSRSAYLDPLPPRSNYAVLANAHVTRLLFDSSSSVGNLTANAVEYTRDGGNTKVTVKANKEVILAGGSIGSPAVLMYSGVGPKDVLAAAGVKLVSELPGVGQHVQDHISVNVQWSTKQETAGSIYSDNTNNLKNDPTFLSYVNSATAYVNSTTIFGAGLAGFQSGIIGEVDQYTPKSSSDPNVIAGYKAIYNTTATTIFNSPVGQVELLLANNDYGDIAITAALQHPYSHGSITINSSNPMDYPVIDPNYLSHPADVAILREGLKLARRVGQTQPLAGSMTNETAPGTSTQSDQQWEDFLRNGIGTEFHPSSSCAMLPLTQGGVVDGNLRVYGLSNVRVADASVPPIVFAAHLMSSTYGIAEQASNIIRAYHNLPQTTKPTVNKGTNTTSGSKTSSSSVSTTSSTSTSSSTSNGNAASSLYPSIFVTAVVACLISLLLQVNH